MNPFDRDNLEWYMSISDEERNAWAEDMGLEHIAYMVGVLRQAQTELMCEQLDELEVKINPRMTQARRVIARVRRG